MTTDDVLRKIREALAPHPVRQPDDISPTHWLTLGMTWYSQDRERAVVVEVHQDGAFTWHRKRADGAKWALGRPSPRMTEVTEDLADALAELMTESPSKVTP